MTRDGARDVLRDVLRSRWADIGEKIVTLAVAFPEPKYEFRPTPDVRSFGDQLRHVAFWNTFVHQSLRGEGPDGTANELSREEYPTKASIIAALRQSLDAVARELTGGKGSPKPSEADLLVSFIEHSGEHYGQLVMYYRLSGLVPPVSRAAGG